MSSFLDCSLCILRQSLEAARFSTNDESTQSKIVEASMKILLEHGLDAPAPFTGTLVHRAVRDITGDPDPYLAEKKRFNALALERLDDVREWLESAKDKRETILKLAIAGNSIDFALENITPEKIDAAIRGAVDAPLVGSAKEFFDAAQNARSILYLTDNAGEIVYDKLLVETLVNDLGKSVVVATRGEPILNDALLDDAREIGLDSVARVIDNGGDGLGTIFDLTSQEFQREFVNADLVVAKGLANFESLTAPGQKLLPKKIAFLFKAKCRFIAESVGAKLGDLIVRIQ